MSTPYRIQRQRTKGCRTPENTVYVGQGTKWGNPWKVTPHEDGRATVTDPISCTAFESVPAATAHATGSFRWQLLNHPNVLGFTETEASAELAGKNLACSCPLDQPCHADVLLEIANREEEAA